MQVVRFLAFAAASSGESSVVSRASVTPVEKAIKLLGNMLVKAKQEKKDEAVQFAAFVQFCDDVTVQKQDSVKLADTQIEMLKADVEKYEVDAERLDKEVEQHHVDVKGFAADIGAARKDREEEHAVYTKAHADYSESIAALTEAIAVVKKQTHDRPQAVMLLQHVQSLRTAPLALKTAISAFLERSGDIDVTAPEANAYEFQSGGVVSMLEDLKEKFVAKRNELEREEMMQQHAFESLAQDLGHSVAASQNQLKDDVDASARAKQAKADTQANQDETAASRTDDKKYLDGLITTCRQKTDDYHARQSMRADEISALEKAIEILSGDNVAVAASRHLPSLLQGHIGSSFAQLRTSRQSPDSQARVAAFLREEAGKIGSQILSAVSIRVQADPFGKVKKLIEQLVARLQAEAAEEADHKQWCDEELGANNHTRTTKTAEVEMLTAEIEGLDSKIASLTKALVELSQDLADLDAAVAKATQMRNAEQAQNEQTIIDAQDGEVAVSQAMELLVAFYSKAADATVLVQDTQRGQKQQPPAIFNDPFRGQQLQSNNVLAFLDVVKSDFARLEKETKASEAAANSEYNDFMADSSADKQQKEADQAQKSGEKQTAEKTRSDKQDDLESAQSQLDAANVYFEKLRPSCIDQGVSFDSRVARRQEEIESLQEALRILNGEEGSGFWYKGEWHSRMD